jgi:beta-phosphoglucomutase-like phosphatase (HAD superfamily)
MNKSQLQAIREVIEATRLHSKAIHSIRSVQHSGENLKDIEEGLDISATKLEVALKENKGLFDGMVDALTAAIELIDQYEEPRKKICGKSSVTRNAIEYVLRKAKGQK